MLKYTMVNHKCKHYCFTLNNPTDDEDTYLVALGAERPDPVVYLIFGREVGESGTPHLQGYIAFNRRVSFSAAKRLISQRVHLEKTKGTPSQAADYCRKEGNFVEAGELPLGQGARTDLQTVCDLIKSGESLRKVAEVHPTTYAKYSTGLQRLAMFKKPKRPNPPRIMVFWGEPGTGKSRRVREFVNDDELWVSPGSEWFDGYDAHAAALFDDFDGSWFKITKLLQLLDRYVIPVRIKGSHTWWVPSTIYITSNKKPDDWYPNASEVHRAAIRRRLRDFGTITECLGYPE